MKMKTSMKKMLWLLGAIGFGLISVQTARAQAALDSNGTTVYNTRSDASANYRIMFNFQVWYQTSNGQFSTQIYAWISPGVNGTNLAPAGQAGDSYDYYNDLAAEAESRAAEDAYVHENGAVIQVDFFNVWLNQFYFNNAY